MSDQNPVARLSTLNAKFGGIEEYRPAKRQVLTFCPGCRMSHPFTVEVYDGYTTRDGQPEPTWDWDGNLESPTFRPSLLCYSSVHICRGEHPPEPCPDHDTCEINGHQVLNEDWRVNGARDFGHVTPHTKEPAWGNCHSFLRNGVWEFLTDSAHPLAGQSVPMVPLPDWLMGGVE